MLGLDRYRTPIISCNICFGGGATDFDCAVVFITMLLITENSYASHYHKIRKSARQSSDRHIVDLRVGTVSMTTGLDKTSHQANVLKGPCPLDKSVPTTNIELDSEASGKKYSKMINNAKKCTKI